MSERILDALLVLSHPSHQAGTLTALFVEFAAALGRVWFPGIGAIELELEAPIPILLFGIYQLIGSAAWSRFDEDDKEDVCQISLNKATHNYFHPTALADKLLNTLGPAFLGPIAIITIWSYSLFYVMADLWGSVVISVSFGGLLIS
ncbi:hypothetical protein ACH5RR_015912 [Cinchona calisaya]|uniref:ADP,ATP carrier protein n=1 Tax=Cinchona calisaya TaxID=153742 RepID=A0ABD2ZUV2_9GENT